PPRPVPTSGAQPALGLLAYASTRIPWRWLIGAAAVVLGLLLAWLELANWDTVLRFLYQAPFGDNDPVFGHDIGFYLFSLPAYIALKTWLLGLLILSAALAGVVYWAHGDIELDKPRRRFSPPLVSHASALLGLWFVLKAWSYYLDRYLLLYSDNGVVVGAGYTDVQLRLPVLWLLIVLALLGAVAAAANLWQRTWRIPVAAVVLLFGSSFLFYGLVPAFFQRLYVRANELELESPYIARNIALTRQAYSLQQIDVKPFPAEEGLTFGSLEANRATIDNIRLWDWQPLI